MLENDVDSDPLSVSAFTDPIYGTAVLSGTAQLIYTPAQDFHGVDAFTYPVSDSDLTDTASISVTVKPINDAPVIAEGTRVEVSMSEDGVPKPFRLTLHGEDVEDEPLTWSVGAPPLHGTAIVAAGPAVSQTVACTPAVNYHGPDAFPVQVSDGILTDTLTVSVTDAPVGGPDTLVALRKRGSGLVEMLGNASAGVLDVLANDTDVDDENRRVSSVGAPSQGGTTGVSAGAVNVIYALTAAFVGRETFTYTVTDGDLTDTTVVSATVTEGAGGGVSGDTAESGRAVVTTDTGASDAFVVTLEIPDGAAGDENLALVYDDLLDGSSSPPQGYTQAGLNFTLDGYVDGQSVDLGYELQHPLTLTLDYKQADIAEIGPCEQTLALFYRDGDPWVSDGVTIAKHDLDW